MHYRFESRVAGIPCLIEVTHYAPAVEAYRQGHPDDWMPGEPAELEFQVCDRQGRMASWLERKLTEGESERIAAQACSLLEQSWRSL
ncbi:hypothetical protein [Simplicispira metamorpha]|uniref:Uncharacterized protein n=1 Tax=Simplicispira metamorpha TaxID=80881 RepID=A0A4R2NEJ4_9BURK|nr:hypothetical protein [Simplicispira metamorpha]TCP19691.1 hypothetical protein EV674_104152 [Simplicispira metamorpha]